MRLATQAQSQSQSHASKKCRKTQTAFIQKHWFRLSVCVKVLNPNIFHNRNYMDVARSRRWNGSNRSAERLNIKADGEAWGEGVCSTFIYWINTPNSHRTSVGLDEDTTVMILLDVCSKCCSLFSSHFHNLLLTIMHNQSIDMINVCLHGIE